MNLLQEFPFYDLDDREFTFAIGNWTGQFDEVMKFDLYNILPNPDKNDEADPDSIFNNPQTEHYSVSKLNNLSNTTQSKGLFLFHCNIRRLTKNLTLLNDMLYSLDSRPGVMAITETRLSSNSITNLDKYQIVIFSILIHPHLQEVQLFMLTKLSMPFQDLICK